MGVMLFPFGGLLKITTSFCLLLFVGGLLKTQAGSLSLRSQSKARDPIPSWNFIDPSALENVREN